MVDNEPSHDRQPEAYRDYLRLLARMWSPRRLQRKMDASDLVQDALVKAYVKRDQFKGEPYVADFGLSKPVESEDMDGAGYIVGAPAYMPPEQIHGETTTLSDVYGLGAIFYWSLTGRPPFQSDSREETLRRVLQEDPERPLAINARVDGDLEAVCLECLKKDPNERYRSTEGLAKDLDRWLAGKETSARKWFAAYRLWRWCRRNPLVAGLTALISLLVLSVAIIGSVVSIQLQQALTAEREIGVVGIMVEIGPVRPKSEAN